MLNTTFAILAVAFGIILTACSQPNTMPQDDMTSQPGIPLVSAPTAKMKFTNDNWHLILGEAKVEQEDYLGSEVDITGKVSQILRTSDSETQFTIETEDGVTIGNSTLIVVPANIQVTEDEWVRAVGTLHSYWDTENLLGRTLHLPVVAAHVTPISRSEAVPPIVTIVVQQSIIQHGLTITLDRLELAGSETRVYVSAANNSPDKASLYSFNAVLVQGTRQIGKRTVFGEEMQEPDTTLVSGTETQGILLFEPAEPDRPPIRVIWEGPRTDNYSLTFDEWEWEISW